MAGNIFFTISGRANLTQVNSQIAAMSKSMAALQNEANRISGRLRETGQYSETQWNSLKNNAQGVRKEYKDLLQASGEYTVATKNLTSQTTKFNEQLARQKVRFRDVWGVKNQRMIREAMREQMALNNMMATAWTKDATGKMNADIFVPKSVEIKRFDHIRQQIGYYRNILHSVSQETVNWGKNTQWTGRQLTVGFSVPISIAAGLLSKFTLEAESGLTRIAKVYGDTEGYFQATNDSIKNMARDTSLYIAEQYGIAAKETREVMAELAATGMEGSELQGMTHSVQRLSLLGEMSPDDSLKLARILKEVYGLTAQELDKQVDYFNAIENSTALTMQDITEGLPRISGIMKATGTSIEEQTELLVAFKAAGIDVAEGANALKSINFKAIAATPTARKSFLELTGEDMDALIKKHNAEFMPMMMEISQIMETMNQPDKMALVQRVFGIHQGGRALTLIEQLTKGSEAMIRAQEVGMMSAEERAASAQKEISTIQNDLATRFRRMVETIKAAAEELGRPVLELIIPIGEQIAKLMKWFTELSETTKKSAALTALFLAAIGPAVMLVGLLANLVGIGGRVAAMLLGLAGKFKILNPLEKAAALLQENFASTAQKAASATKIQTDAVTKLTAAMRELADVHGLVQRKQLDQYAIDNGLEDIPTNIRPAHVSKTQRAVSVYRDGKRVPGEVRYVDEYKTSKMWRDEKGKFVKAPPTLGPQTFAEFAKENEVAEKSAEAYNRKIIGVEDTTKRIVDQQKEHHAALERTQASMNKFGASIMGAGVAMGALGTIIKNDTLANVSMLAMSIGGLMPVITHLSSTMLEGTLKWSTAAKARATGVKGALVTASTAAIDGFGKFSKFLTGPWGIAVGAAVAGLVLLWKRHQNQLKEIRETYTDLADTKDDLGDIYGFQPKSHIERQMEDPDYDPNTRWGQQARIQEMRKNNQEFYDELVKYSERARKVLDDTAREQEVLNEAIAQGRVVLQQTGNSELAKQAAWDAYNIMADEWVDFEAFRAKVVIGNGDEFRESIDALLSDLDVAGTQAGQRLQNRISSALSQKKLLKTDDVAAIRKDTVQAFDSILTMEDIESRYQAMQGTFGEQLGSLHDMYIQALEQGLIEEGTSLKEFADDIVDHLDKVMVEKPWGSQITVFDGYSKNEILALREVALGIDEVDAGLLKQLESERNIASVYSGKLDLMMQQVDAQELLNKKKELEHEISEGRGEGERAKQLRAQISLAEKLAGIQYVGEIAREREQKKVDEFSGKLKHVQSLLGELGSAGLEAGDDIGEGMDEATDATEKLTRAQQNNLDAHRSSMEFAQQMAVDRITKQFDAMQNAERTAFEKQADADMKAIEDFYKAEEKKAEASANARKKALDERHRRQKEALDDEKDAAKEALDLTFEASSKALDARRKAAQEQQKQEQKALKKAQELRREQIKETFDLQVEKINAQIEEEERLEKIRQQMFEAEKERIRRLQDMFSSNIDLNMAINSGDLDEAARIAGEMRTRQGEWAQDDLSKISQEGSDSRKDKMRAEIDSINERRDAELERIKAVEEAEDEALDKKFERIQEEIAAEKEKQAELKKIQQKALDEDFAAREKNLSDRQTIEKENLDASVAADRESLAEKRENARTQQEEVTASNKAALDQRLADAKANYELDMEYWRNNVATNEAEFIEGVRAMETYFAKEHLPSLKETDAKEFANISEARNKKFKNEMNRLSNDDVWEDSAEKIANKIINGAIGFNMTVAQIEKFIKTGELPKEPKRSNYGKFIRTEKSALHSGGIAGKDSNWTGPGFVGPSQEVNATLLKGEGVLNLRAMNKPGVKEMMYALNAGKMPTDSPAVPDSKRLLAQRGGGSPSGLARIIPMITKRITEQAIMSGLEVGANKAESMMSGVNIKLGEKERQGLTDEQLANASAIVSTGKKLGMSDRDIVIGLMTAMQESSLRNLNYGDDIHGVRNPDGSLTSSIGLFQQQNWWGTRAERLDPYKSSEIFFRELMKVPNRNEMTTWQAAQAVQRSAYPRAYAKWESLARVILGGAAIEDISGTNYSIGNKERLEDLKKRLEAIKESQKGYFMPTSGLVTWLFGNRRLFAWPDHHDGLDIANNVGTPVYAASSGVASTGYDFGGGKYISVMANDGTRHIYYHLSSTGIRNGQEINRGQRIASMGNTGVWTTGPHLHFEVQKNGRPVPAENFFSPRPTKRSYVTAGGGFGMRNGGFVTGSGFGDIAPRILEPGEFVVNRASAKKNVELLKAINASAVDFTPDLSGLAHASVGARSNVDNGGGNSYNIKMEFTGPVNSEVDIEKAVKKTITAIERRKPKSRRIG